MKKYFIVVCSLLFITSAKAEVYYSDYGEYSSFSENIIYESDVVDVDIQRRFKRSKIGIEGQYYLEGDNPELYPKVDYENFDYAYYEWSSKKPKNMINRTIEEKMGIAGTLIRYIYITNPNGVDGKLNISEIEVYDKYNRKLNYVFLCGNCSPNMELYINNGIIGENNSYLRNSTGELRIDLGAYFYIEDLKLNIYEYSESDEERSFDVKFKETYSTNVNEAFIISMKTNKKNDIIPITIRINDDDLDITNTFPNSINKVYRFNDKYYFYYRDDAIIYDDGYFLEANEEFPNLDDSDYRDYYRYRIRDKFVLDDNLIIKNKDTKLEDFVLENTCDFKIETNIDMNKNGIYDIKFILPFMAINKKIEVYLAENSYNELLIKLENLENDINNLNNINNNVESENSNLLNQINDLNKLLEKNKKNLEKIKDKNDKLNNTNKELKQSIKDLNKEINENKKENEKLELNNSILNEQISKNENDKNNLLKLITDYQEKLLTQNQIFEKDINSILKINEELNDKINKQNYDIDAVSKVNKNNQEEFQSNLVYLDSQIKELEKQKNNIIDDYNMCLDSEKEKYLIEVEKEKTAKKKNSMIYLILIITIITSVIFFKKNVELK